MSLSAQLAGESRIDAWVDTLPVAESEARLDQIAADTGRQQLPARNNAALPHGQLVKIAQTSAFPGEMVPTGADKTPLLALDVKFWACQAQNFT